MPRKLKVFRTPIGFHDAYVAAPSRKAALKAWGSDADLFARGVAEEVTEPKLTKAPLADPGAVIRVSRGSVDDHLAALPKTKKVKPKPAGSDDPPARAGKRAPRPGRGKLDAADRALADARDDFAAHDKALADKEAALAADRKALERERKEALARLTGARDDAQDAYNQALADWEM